MVVYKITNINNGLVYVGQTTRAPKVRWYEHRYDLRNASHGNRHLQAAWNKHGESAFTFEVIQTCETLSQLNEAEMGLINTTPRLYNMTAGGTGFIHSEKAKSTISEKQKIPVVGISISTGEIKHYSSAVDARIDGFDPKNVRKCAVDYRTKPSARKYSMGSISHKGWVWIDKADFTKEKLEKKAEVAKFARVRGERSVLATPISGEGSLSFGSATKAAKHLGIAATAIGQA